MADRLAPENGGIKITPEMIEAGREAYYATDYYLTTEEDRYAAIYRAMENARTLERA